MDDLKNDIEKYLKGELSSAEMHKLEMKALHDPFLAEALEGAEILDAKSFISDVDAIDKKIQSHNKSKYYWPIRIAASVLLLISVTYVVFRTAPENTTKQLALQKNTEAADEIHPIISDTLEDTKNIPENLLSLKAEEKPIAEIKPKIKIDIKEKPVETKEGIKKDTIVEITQPLQLASESEMGEESKAELTTELDEINKEQIAESKTTQQRTRSEASKKSVTPSPTSGLSADKQDVIETKIDKPSPTVGIVAYQKYLKDNVKYPKAALENNISGEVTISFNVNSDGTLSNFFIEKGIGYGCDEELIRLIKNGPVWIPAVKNNTSVNQKTSLSFVFDTPK